MLSPEGIAQNQERDDTDLANIELGGVNREKREQGKISLEMQERTGKGSRTGKLGFLTFEGASEVSVAHTRRIHPAGHRERRLPHRCIRPGAAAAHGSRGPPNVFNVSACPKDDSL